MNPSETPRPWQEALGEIYRRSAVDADFRRLCTTDTKSAFQAVGNFDLPADVKLRFIEKPEEILFILPPLAADGSMSADELDMVAGGTPGGAYYPVTYPYGYGYQWGVPGPGMGPANTPTGLPPMVPPGGPPPGY